jgi:hypothetical protein
VADCKPLQPGVNMAEGDPAALNKWSRRITQPKTQGASQVRARYAAGAKPSRRAQPPRCSARCSLLAPAPPYRHLPDWIVAQHTTSAAHRSTPSRAAANPPPTTPPNARRQHVVTQRPFADAVSSPLTRRGVYEYLLY